MHIQPLDILRINLFTILVQFGPISAKTSTGWGKSAEINLHSFRSLSETWWALKTNTGWGKSAAVCTVFEVWSLKHVVGGLRLSDKNQHWADLHSFFRSEVWYTWWADRGVQTTNLRLHTVQCTVPNVHILSANTFSGWAWHQKALPDLVGNNRVHGRCGSQLTNISPHNMDISTLH